MRSQYLNSCEAPEKVAIDGTFALFTELKRLLGEKAGNVTVALSGGSSVKGLYEDIHHVALLENIGMEHSFFDEKEWERIHFFWADERCVGPEDPQSNYGLAKELFLQTLLDSGALPLGNIHRYIGEAEDPQEAIKQYNQELARVSDGRLDILILGSGPDGHTASLFPGHELLEHEKKEFVLISDSPKPPAQRMTISPQHILDAEAILLLFMGEAKQDAYERFTQGSLPKELPVALCKHGPADKRLHVLSDRC